MSGIDLKYNSFKVCSFLSTAFMFTFLYLLKRVTAFFHRNISDFASSFFQFYACAKLVPAAGYSKNVQ